MTYCQSNRLYVQLTDQGDVSINNAVADVVYLQFLFIFVVNVITVVVLEERWMDPTYFSLIAVLLTRN
jgi:hypothetical protein